MKKILPVAVFTAALLLTACSSTPAESSDPAETQGAAQMDSKATASQPAASPEQLIKRAETAVESELPDAPIWEGMTFKGVALSDTTVCVDRTYAEGKGITNIGGSAGYVIVQFPSVTLGEPQDGQCKDAEVASSTTPTPVEVPERVAGEPGLVTRDQLGDKWPLTIDYGVVRCENIVVAGRTLQIASIEDPSGREYAMNGTARSHTSLGDVEQIWRENPDVEGLKINIQPVIDRALVLCS